MMFEKRTKVNGVIVRLVPYTEKRRSLLDQVNADIRDYAAKHSDMSWETMPLDKKAEFWKAKADILWDAETPLDLNFFKSEEFEYTILKDTEDFFLMTRLYL